MKNFQTRPIELDAAMIAFLEQAAQKYSLPDIGKAVRCLVNYARENPDKADEIFREVRCLEC
jgi:hypothetical protein